MTYMPRVLGAYYLLMHNYYTRATKGFHETSARMEKGELITDLELEARRNDDTPVQPPCCVSPGRLLAAVHYTRALYFVVKMYFFLMLRLVTTVALFLSTKIGWLAAARLLPL